MKQKGDDYKITAVKYYLNNNYTINKTCNFFNYKPLIIHRWMQASIIN
jgi:transposase-like protein